MDKHFPPGQNKQIIIELHFLQTLTIVRYVMRNRLIYQ